MIDLIAKLISGDGLSTVLVGVALYLGLLWALFSFWVYVDAKKRYQKTVIAVVFFIVVLVFNFPALVFYLITRPEDENDYVLLPSEHLNNKGINVPIVNFVGKDGKVNLSFELKINNPEFVNNSDMAINIDWKSQKPEFVQEVMPVEVKVETNSKEENRKNKKEKNKIKESESPKSSEAVNYKQKAVNSFKRVKNQVSGFKPKFSIPAKKEANKQAK